jgi:hypothetical protein
MSEASIGAVGVVTTDNQGHPPEFYAERIVSRLINVSELAPPEIREQALAYQASMRQVVLDGVRRAILSNHTTVIALLRKAGMNEAAELVHKMRD